MTVQELARRWRFSREPSASPDPMLVAFIEKAANRLHTSAADVMGPRRVQHIADARAVAMFNIRNVGGYSLPEVGRLFNRHHTTVLEACRRVERTARLSAIARAILLEIGIAP